MASSAKGPVPTSTTLTPVVPDRRRRSASSNAGVRTASSRMDSYASMENSVPAANDSVCQLVSSCSGCERAQE